MILIPHHVFEKKAAKLPKNVTQAIVERLRLFTCDSLHPLLNNYSLHGSLRHYRSINITGDYRLIYEQYDEHTVRLIDIDTHSKLYGR